MWNRQRVVEFKKTRQYTLEDFDLLCGFLGNFARVVTTQCILTEVSNLLGLGLDDQCFRSYSVQILKLHEPLIPSAQLANSSLFPRFGLTDTSVYHAGANKFLILTDDLPLSNYLEKQGVDVINFTHIRWLSWELT
jgi:hypothetical protein